jgi:hypothetical protein
MTYAHATPMSVSTATATDNDALEKLCKRYARAQERHDVPGCHDTERAMATLLLPVTRLMYETIQHAVALCDRANLPELSAVSRWRGDEVRAFLGFIRNPHWSSSARGDARIKRNAFELLTREDAAANVHAVITIEDEFARAAAICSGTALRCRVEEHFEQRVDSRAKIHRMTVTSGQRDLAIREGDRLYCADDPRVSVSVMAMVRANDRTTITLRVTAGMRKPGIPEVGRHVTLVPARPDWHRIGQQRAIVAERTNPMPWTHRPHAHHAPTPSAAGSIPFANPLQALEALR